MVYNIIMDEIEPKEQFLILLQIFTV